MEKMMNRRPRRRIAVAALAAAIFVSMLGITACSSSAAGSGAGTAGSDSSQGAVVFDFPQNQLAPAETVRASFPSDLQKAAGLSDDDVLVTDFVLSGRKLDSAELCAFDVQVTYSDSGKDTLLGDVSAFANGSSLKDYEILAGWIIRQAPVQDHALDRSGEIERGVYVSDGGHTLTVVVPCGTSASDPDKANSVYWPVKGTHGVDVFASLSVVPMKNGTIGVTGSVDDYARDANGDWIKH